MRWIVPLLKRQIYMYAMQEATFFLQYEFHNQVQRKDKKGSLKENTLVLVACGSLRK